MCDQEHNISIKILIMIFISYDYFFLEKPLFRTLYNKEYAQLYYIHKCIESIIFLKIVYSMIIEINISYSFNINKI